MNLNTAFSFIQLCACVCMCACTYYTSISIDSNVTSALKKKKVKLLLEFITKVLLCSLVKRKYPIFVSDQTLLTVLHYKDASNITQTGTGLKITRCYSHHIRKKIIKTIFGLKTVVHSGYIISNISQHKSHA